RDRLQRPVHGGDGAASQRRESALRRATRVRRRGRPQDPRHLDDNAVRRRAARGTGFEHHVPGRTIAEGVRRMTRPDIWEALRAEDPDIAGLIEAEERRERDKVRLIPSENYVSHAVLAATGPVLRNKYPDGTLGKHYYDMAHDLAKRERPKLIWCGGTAIPTLIDFEAFGGIARDSGAILAADIAHIAGLIAGGAHPSPVGIADAITTTTHKTLRGPRGAMVMSRAEHAKALDRAVFPGLQGGPHNHTTAAIAVALREAATPEFSTYAHTIVSNAKALADGLIARGFDLVSGGP